MLVWWRRPSINVPTRCWATTSRWPLPSVGRWPWSPFVRTRSTRRSPAGGSPPVDIAVTVDARVAAPTNGESGVAVLAGPRIGRRALEEILCNGTVEVIGHHRDRRATEPGPAHSDREPQAAAPHPAPGRRLHRRGLSFPLSARGPPFGALVPWRAHRRRLAGNALLVSSPCRGPSPRPGADPHRPITGQVETTVDRGGPSPPPRITPGPAGRPTRRQRRSARSWRLRATPGSR